MEPGLQPHMRKVVPHLATFLPLNWKAQSYRLLGSPVRPLIFWVGNLKPGVSYTHSSSLPGGL